MDRVRTFGMRYLLGLLICVATSRNGSVRDVIDGQEYLIVEEVEETTLWAKIWENNEIAKCVLIMTQTIIELFEQFINALYTMKDPIFTWNM